jgi:hypothetical protein
LQVIVIIIIRVTKARIFVKPLHHSSLNCFLRYLLLHLPRLFEFGLKSTTIWGLDFSLTSWAIHKGKTNARSCPFGFDFTHDAVQVENMVARKHDTRALAESICITNGAIIICLLTHCNLLVNRNTGFIKTRKALSFLRKTIARMTTSQNLIASFVH